MVPAVLMSVPYLVVTKGGDALNICFNTVAVLFLMDVDNLSYEFGLNEMLRKKIADCGKISLTAEQDDGLKRVKNVHTVLSMLCIVANVALMGFGIGIQVGPVLPYVLLLIGGIVDYSHPGTELSLCSLVAGWLGGLLAFVSVFLITMMKHDLEHYF